ncbi:FecR family protein [Ancylobacter sp. IITR112]|uniref:FecR family protein n=1 Tax=Ancylobacter sp. IITR112 TaxID=3138073 RepID=UPI00352A65F2
MTEDASSDDKLFEEALDLIIRLQNDPANPVTRDLVAGWRARGASHEAAWAEAAELHGMAGKVLQGGRGGERPGRGGSRRTVMLGGLAALATAGAGAAFGPALWIHLRADYATSTGELRRITLADATVVTLGPDTALRSTFTPTTRQAELLAGMAFFEVAPDPSRPFTVAAGEMRARALATAFDIGVDAGFVRLAVDRGRVRAEGPGPALARGETVEAGRYLTLDQNTFGVESGPRESGSIGSWRDGLIVAEREPISSVVARIARWQAGRVMILDPGLGAQRISGVFDLGNPRAALEAVVHPRGGKVRQLSPWLTLITSV